jgi:hypothetical protein
MQVELLLVPDCPHAEAAHAAVRAALDEVGLAGLTLEVTVIDSDETARRRGFTGSPTFLIDGADPFAEPGRPPALACRVYPTDDGLAGIPPQPALVRALRAAIAAR